MEKLIILDYTNATVDLYDVNNTSIVDESYIEDLGYNANNCHWMCGKNIQITYHKEMLT